MDTTLKFIEMCQKANEIQKLAVRDSYFWDLANFPDGLFYIREYDNFFVLPPENHRSVWLPRQDQLQEMINKEYFAEMIDTLIDFSHIKIEKNFYYKFKSTFEKIWLEIVMLHKYDKIWNEEVEEWVKYKHF